MKWMCKAGIALGLTLAMTASTAMAQLWVGDQDMQADWPMNQSPELEPAQPPTAYHPRLMALWMQALARPDAQTRYQAASAIAQAARQGMPGLEATLERLDTLLENEEEHALARLAAAEAIIALDSRAHAPALHQAALHDGQDMTLLTDPALARWKHEPAIASWRQRVIDEAQTRVLRLSAIRSLAAAEDRSSTSLLRDVALDEAQHALLRLAAAQAYAQLAPGGQAGAIPQVAANAALIDKLVTAWLLAGHEDVERLATLASRHEEPAEAIVAVRRLASLEPARIDALIPAYSQSGDAGLRRVAIDRLAALKQAGRLSALASFLADVDPDLRILARDHLVALAEDASLQSAVHAALRQALASSAPRGIEQAAMAIGEVGPDDTADALLKLLDHDDQAVGVAAATALRKRSLPNTLSGALASVRKYAFIKDITQVRDEQTAQLIQLLGEHRHAEATADLRKLIPKGSGGILTRQAGIWALGMILEGKPDAQLARQLVGRARDTMSMEPEDDGVRRQAMVALGRMKAQDQLAALEQLSRDDGLAATGMAARWAIGQITGQRPAEPSVKPSMVTGWFLEPLD